MAQRQQQLKSVTGDLEFARREIHGRRALHERITELVELASDLTKSISKLSSGLETLRYLEQPVFDDEVDFHAEVERFEMWLIKRALKRTGGSQNETARLLRMRPTTLSSKLKSFRLGPWDSP